MNYWLYEIAKKYPNRPAVITEDVSINYGELLELVENTVYSLQNIMDLSRASKIAILLDNRIETILLIHAFGFLDTFPVLINTRLTSDEINWQLKKLELDKIIVSEDTFPKVKNMSHKLKRYSVDESVSEASYMPLNITGEKTDIGDFNPNNIQSLVFTSGTTGKPKAAVLQYTNIYASASASSVRLGVQENDLWMLTIPLYHVGGLSILFRSCLNGTAVFLDKKFKPERIVELINQYRITIVSLVPTMLQWLITHQSLSVPIPTLRLILLGGDRASMDLIENCKNLDLPVATTYGMTESVSQVATALKFQVFEKPLSVGKPLDGFEVKILTPHKTECEPNHVGEIYISGPAVINGYWHESSLSFSDNGFNTGDVGYLDGEGDLHILQRRVDLIVSGGENIYPSEIENHIRTIDRVQEVCVIGIDDKDWGQIPVAFIQTDENQNIENLIIESCKSHLAAYKIPKRFIFVDEYPRNSLGKIIRTKLKELIG